MKKRLFRGISRAVPASKQGPYSGLYAEFAEFYSRYRCADAPANPRRVFNLCFKWANKRYGKRISPAETLSALYRTLGNWKEGARSHCKSGLFSSFNLASYQGKLSPQDHFLSLTRSKLLGHLRKMAYPKKQRRSTPDIELIERSDEQEREHGPDWRRELIENVTKLPEPQQSVVWWRYWDNLTMCEIATRNGVNHSTVSRWHGKALRLLRKSYGLDAEKTSWNPCTKQLRESHYHY